MPSHEIAVCTKVGYESMNHFCLLIRSEMKDGYFWRESGILDGGRIISHEFQGARCMVSWPTAGVEPWVS